jgi:hypothetical protein
VAVAGAICRDMMGYLQDTCKGQRLVQTVADRSNGECDFNIIPGVSFIVVLNSLGVTGYAGECGRSMR